MNPRKTNSGRSSHHGEGHRSIAGLGSRLAFHSLIGALECERRLLGPNGLDNLPRTLGSTAARNLKTAAGFEGYKLATIVPAYQLLDAAINWPETLGVDSLEGLSEMFHWNFGVFPIPDGDSHHERLIRNFWWVRTRLISARNWRTFQDSTSEISVFLSDVESILNECYAVKLEPSKQVRQLSQLRRFIGLNFLHRIFHDLGNVHMAYSEMYRSAQSGDTASWNRVGSSTSSESSSREDKMLPGYKAALLSLWSGFVESNDIQLCSTLFSDIVEAKGWEELDNLYGEAGRVADQFLKPAHMEDFPLSGPNVVKVRSISAKSVAKLIESRDVRIPEYNKLDRIFELRPVRVGASHPFVAMNYFHLLFTGLLSVANTPRKRIRLVRLRHQDSAGSRFSYALFIPGFGTALSNASEYWILPDIATDFSGNGTQNKLLVDALIEGAGRRVDVRDYDVPKIEDLQNYLASRQLKFLRLRVDQFEALLASFRGALSETLVAILLGREGFEVVDIRRRLKWLGGREVDIIAKKRGAHPGLLLIECKAALDCPPLRGLEPDADSRPALNRDLEDALSFVRLVKIRSRNNQTLFDELGLGGPVRVTAVVAAVGTINPVSRKVLSRFGTVWDWKNLSERFVRAGLARSIWRSIERFADSEQQVTQLLDLDEQLNSNLDVWLNR